MKKWDSRAESWFDRRFSFQSSYLRWTQQKLVSLLEMRENPHLLDLGCGIGWAVRYAASLANGRGEFYGIDISSKMIEKAEASSTNYKNVHFRKANAEVLPFENDFSDFIICSNSFHQALFAKAGLHYVISKSVVSSMKVHMAEKVASSLRLMN